MLDDMTDLLATAAIYIRKLRTSRGEKIQRHSDSGGVDRETYHNLVASFEFEIKFI